MNKKYLAIGIVIVLFVISMVCVELFYDEEENYQNALEGIEYHKNLCESAGFMFEIDGHLNSPEEQSNSIFTDLTWNNVILKCYELKGDVKIYQNFKERNFIETGEIKK